LEGEVTPVGYTRLEDPVAEPNDVEKGEVTPSTSADGGCEGGA